MQSRYYGASRILSTYGRLGDTDAVINILDEYASLLEKDKENLSFYYGTVVMPSNGTDDNDPFSVWVNEIWTHESARRKALRKDEIVTLEKRIAKYLEFDPEEGVQIDIRGGKFNI